MTSLQIQNEVDVVAAAGGGEVVIPTGVHLLDRPIRLPAGKSIRFIGKGASSELRAQYGAGPVLSMEGPDGGSRNHSKEIAHLRLSREPSFSNTGSGLFIKDTAYLILHDLHITQQDIGIHIDGASGGIFVRDIWLLPCGTSSGTQFTRTGIHIGDGANYSIERCFMEGTSVGISLSCEAVWIRNCYIFHGEYAIKAIGPRVDINVSQCNVEGYTRSAIYFISGVQRSSIKDCWIGQSSPRSPGPGGGNGIKLDPGCNRISIHGNTMSDIHGAAIEMYRVEAVAIEDNLFAQIGRNDASGNAPNSPVVYLSNSKEITVARNRFEGGLSNVGIKMDTVGGPNERISVRPDNDFSQFGSRPHTA